MRVSLALYDPSQPSSDGSYWSWRASCLDRNSLDQLFYKVATSDRPDDPGRLGPSNVVGGLARVAPDWIYAYRYGDGGRDVRGRPGRFVMVVVGFRMEDAHGIDLKAIMTCPAMVETLANAPLSDPVPAPEELEFDVATQPSRVDPVLVAKALRGERLELCGPEAVAQAGALCAGLPMNRLWTCRLGVNNHEAFAVVECPREEEEPGLQLSNMPAANRTEVIAEKPSRSGRTDPQSRRYRLRSGVIVGVAILIIGLFFKWRLSHPARYDQGPPGAASQPMPANASAPQSRPATASPTIDTAGR